jgi:hypothetical protein
MITDDQIEVVASLLQGDYAAQSEVSSTVSVGKLPVGDYKVSVYGRRRHTTTSPYGDPNLYAGTTFSVTPQTLTAIEFYHPVLNHYFLTAEPAEIIFLEGNEALGWKATGEKFRVLRADAAAGNVVPVCRFYGSVSPGPNSHFYTASNSECEGLRQLQATTPAAVPRWNFEGISFSASMPVNGQCPVSSPVGLVRLYNNRAAQHDSSHRFVATSSLTASMTSKGWVAEGLVMCVQANHE